ncbi:uncharacterized protein LOC114361954 [Ostrinia furnacalis]|uniref:uncharacterized protein LOC114361954 n=1 Tax=Ostrinia furnacalis TaxID=93504 RepID=UPI00103F60BD|nr:uncharacterized protein LOC114361954 [Ostrinia furnacalis]
MSAHALWVLCAVVCVAGVSATVQDAPAPDKKIELFDGVRVNIPQESNSTGPVMSLEVDTGSTVVGRGKQKKLLERILPMFIMPFLIQSTIVPLFLSMLKFMLMKSLFVGKLALMLIIINAFKNNNAVKGRDAVMADIHYGYHGNGMEEYGAYVN